jgi:hypothetical protein
LLLSYNRWTRILTWKWRKIKSNLPH